MIQKCFNPACAKELRYLRDGRVVRVIRKEDDQTFVRHYWLCGTCYDTYDFVFPPGGEVELQVRAHAHSDKVYIGDVLLVSPPVAGHAVKGA
jgi:hypothetical protein